LFSAIRTAYNEAFYSTLTGTKLFLSARPETCQINSRGLVQNLLAPSGGGRTVINYLWVRSLGSWMPSWAWLYRL